MADIIHTTAFERDDTPEGKWQAAWATFQPIWEEWHNLDDSANSDNTALVSKARAAREEFMVVPAPTISALAIKMSVADASDDDHQELCLADVRMMEWAELVAAYDAAKAEEERVTAIQNVLDNKHLELLQAKPNTPETRKSYEEALASEKVFDAAVDVSSEAWAAILDFPPPTAAAYGIKAQLIRKEMRACRIEDGPALERLLADVQRLLDQGQFPGWNEYRA